MQLSYKQLTPSEVEPACEILHLCGRDMHERLGLDHWALRPYPLEAMRRDAEMRQVYAVLREDLVIATFTLGTEISPFYQKIPAVWEMWATSPVRAMYVNRLAVLPS